MAILLSQLKTTDYDIIRELSETGMGNTATALSTMISAPTDISVPDVKVISAADASRLLTVLSGSTLGLLINIFGDVSGKLIHVIPSLFAERVISTFYEKKITSWDDLSEMDLSVLFEMTNITSAQFCNALSDQLGMIVDISTPQKCVNLAGEVVGSSPQLLFVNTSLSIIESSQKDFVIFIPDEVSVEKIIKRLAKN